MNRLDIDVVKAKVLRDYVMYLEFSDGCSGTIDISKIISFSGVFAPLKDPEYFASVVVDPELGTICWASGADISPNHLREKVAGKAAAA